MTNITHHSLALRFANIDATTKSGARIAGRLSSCASASLWANDVGGDLYIAGLNLCASIGPVRNVTTYDVLLQAFPEFWRLDGVAAKVIAHEIDRAVESETLHELRKDLSLVATWFAEDESDFEPADQPISWERLRSGALSWEHQDAEWMRSHPAQWDSELSANSYSYYAVKPILTTAQLLRVSDGMSKALRRKELQELCVAGQVRIFTVAEVLKMLSGPIATVLIERTGDGWQVRHVYTKDTADVPQSMYRLAHQLALQYQSRAIVNDHVKRTKSVRSRIDATPLISLIAKDGGTESPTQSASCLATPQSAGTASENKAQVMFLDTCTLLEAPEREAVGELIRDFAGTVVIVGAVIDELERKKATRPDLVRDANAALRCIERWLSDGKAEIEGAAAERQRPYADKEIIESADRHVKAGAMVTVITADTALRLRVRAAQPKGRLVTIDSRALVHDNRRPASLDNWHQVEAR